MYTTDTLIIIDIQAPNNTEILTCVRETFEFMPGWQFASSVINSPTDARFYAFNLTTHAFEWWRTNTTFSDTMDEDEIAIKDLADISNLLEFVWLNGDQLRNVYVPPKTEDLASKFEKCFYSSPPFNPMDFIKIQPMNLPTGKVFYKDYAEKSKDKDVSDTLFNEFVQSIEKCKTVSGLQSIHHGLLGLHGPKAGKLRNMVVSAIQKIQMANPPPYEKKSWGYEEEMHEIMAKKYEAYLTSMQKKKVQSWYDDAHTYHKCKPYPYHAEGIMIKPYKYMPYSWSDVYPEKEIDY